MVDQRDEQNQNQSTLQPVVGHGRGRRSRPRQQQQQQQDHRYQQAWPPDARRNISGWNNRGGTWRERRADSSSAHAGQAYRQVQADFSDVRLQENTGQGADGAAVAPELVQDLQRKLAKSEIECMICYDTVGRRSPIWSCRSCFSIFHLTCIRRWARAPTSVDRAAAGVSSGAGYENWRCPGCQAVQHTSADSLRYTCFCEQVIEPSVDMYLTPHSCGGSCQNPLDKSGSILCKHLCTLQCHPGPCPPCVAFAAPETCGCGRTTVTRRCSERDGTIISCGEQCQRKLICGRHRCNRPCHEDDCGPCDAWIMVTCFCGRKQEKLCCQLIPVKGDIDRNTGVYCCESPCSKPLSCGNHSCSEKCHPGSCGLCELSPFEVSSCPCGKRALKDFQVERQSCKDPIPTCGQPCEKLMPCNKHRCQEPCHLGPCPPCEAQEEQKCRCGSSSRVVPCHIASVGVQDEAAYVCDKKCDKKKSCGRHRCNNTCCPSGEYHLCMLECGKKLRCGQHSCKELCHPGHCPPCLLSAFTEVSCACGKSSIPPPVPCGTPIPRCDSSCSFPQACGHSATHTCHFGDCPPCTVPVAKECVGKHMVMRNVPCGSKDIRCNLPCGKTRKCGRHNCSRTCHSDPCDSPQNGRSLSCGQVCGVPRKECTHTCLAPCHPSSLCPDTRCNVAVEITCGCKRLSARVPCDTGAGATRDPLAEARILNLLPAPLQPVDGNIRVPLSKRKLSCNDECGKAEKLKALAGALGIAATDGPAGDGVSDVLQDTLRRDWQFVADVEDRFKYLLSGPKTIAGVGGIRAHAFCSLPKDKREVIHQLAQKWLLSVNSVGWDPKRYMVVHVTAKSKAPAARLTKPNLVPPRFNASLDLDPRLVVALFNLPRDADVSSLVLRFGGECELVWLNDRNALAIFGDATRAATALRRVDHASSYHGAFVMPTAAAIPASWGPSSPSLVAAARKNRSQQRSSLDPAWVEDEWVDEVKGAWRDTRATSVAVSNPWSPLEQARSYPGESSSNNNRSSNNSSSSNSNSKKPVEAEVVDDWENALDEQ